MQLLVTVIKVNLIFVGRFGIYEFFTQNEGVFQIYFHMDISCVWCITSKCLHYFLKISLFCFCGTFKSIWAIFYFSIFMTLCFRKDWIKFSSLDLSMLTNNIQLKKFIPFWIQIYMSTYFIMVTWAGFIFCAPTQFCSLNFPFLCTNKKKCIKRITMYHWEHLVLKWSSI